MSKKLLNKVISAVLVLAICSTAFLGGVVSAATNLDVKVEVANKGYDTIAKDEIVTTTVTLSSADAFVAGIFNVVADSKFELANANVKSVIGVDGTEVDTPSLYQKVTGSEGKVLFQGWDDKDLSVVNSYTTVVVEIELKALEDIEAGVEYTVTVDNVDVTDVDEATSTVATDSITAGKVHEHKFEEVVEDNDASVKTFECTVCEDKKYELVEKESDLSDIPVQEGDENNLASSVNGGYSINFETDGELALVYTTKAIDNKVYLAKLDENDVVVELTESKVLEGKVAFDNTYAGGVKSIGESVKAVFVEVDAAGKVVSKSTVFEKSIADYCEEILASEATDEKTVAAKKYCAALLDYASATQEYLDYNTDNLVNGGTLKGEYAELTEDNNKFDRTEEPTTWKFNGGNITLTTKPTVRLYFSTVGDTNVEDLDFIVSYGVKKDVEVSAEAIKETTIGKKSYYYIDITDLPTKYLSNVITLKTANDEYGTYSVDTYAFNQKDTKVGNAARYLVEYSNALLAAFPG